MKFIDKRVLEEQPEDSKKSDNLNQVVDNKANGSNDGELEFNKKNREDFEQLMKESSTNLDGYWDKDNPFVKILLLILGVIVVFGAIYYVMAYLNK